MLFVVTHFKRDGNTKKTWETAIGGVITLLPRHVLGQYFSSLMDSLEITICKIS